MRAKKRHAKIVGPLLGLCLLTTLASCGSDDDDDDGTPVAQQQEQQGVYRVDLAPANPKVDPDVSGRLTVTRLGDDFRVEGRVDNAPAGTHIQHIHSGSRCATLADDTNGDTYIDAVEAEAVSGSPIIPLDSDLSSNSENSYPSGSSYPYNESASFDLMVRNSGDDNSNAADIATTATGTGSNGTTASGAATTLDGTNANEDDVTDRINEEINDVTESLSNQALEGRVVEIHGVPSSTDLPDSVRGMGGKSAERTFPIACGVLVRVSDAEATGTATGTGTTGTTGTGTATGTGTGTPTNTGAGTGTAPTGTATTTTTGTGTLRI